MAEEDKKYVGVVFRVHNAAGIARISITDTTEATTVLASTDIDLYDALFNRSALPPQYNLWCFWWEVSPANHDYAISVSLSPSTVTERYLEIDHYLENIPITDGSVATTLTAWHTDYESSIYTYNLVEESVVSFEQTYNIDAFGDTTVFALPPTLHAHDFKLFKTSTGDAWRYPTSIDISWGTSESNYEDETIDSTGNFGIKFYTPPLLGSTITFVFIPKTNRYRLYRTMRQPYLADYTNYRREVRLLDDSIELIP